MQISGNSMSRVTWFEWVITYDRTTTTELMSGGQSR